MKKNLLKTSSTRTGLKFYLLITALLFTGYGYAQPPRYFLFKDLQTLNAFPFASSNSDKVQWLYKPSDFKDFSGTKAPSGSITKIHIRSVRPDTVDMTDIVIKLGQTTATSFSSGTYITGMTEVFTKASLEIITPGWVVFTLSKPFAYDNTKSLVVEAEGHNGIIVTHDTGGKQNCRIYGKVGSSSGTVNHGVPEFGFDFAGTNDVKTVADAPDVLLYPNPASDNIRIEAPQDFKGTISIYDMRGKELIKESFGQSIYLPVSNLADGMYFYSVANEERIPVAKGILMIRH